METKQMNLYQKINEVQKRVKSVVKDAEISFGHDTYNVVTHDAVTSALQGPIAEVGIVCWPTSKYCVISESIREKTYNGNITKHTVYRADVTVEMTFINSDAPTEILKTEMGAYAFDTADKAIGKAVSMAVKNIYLKAFMLESKDQEEARPTEDAKFIQKPTQVKNFAPQTQAQAKQLNPTMR